MNLTSNNSSTVAIVDESAIIDALEFLVLLSAREFTIWHIIRVLAFCDGLLIFMPDHFEFHNLFKISILLHVLLVSFLFNFAEIIVKDSFLVGVHDRLQ